MFCTNALHKVITQTTAIDIEGVNNKGLKHI